MSILKSRVLRKIGILGFSLIIVVAGIFTVDSKLRHQASGYLNDAYPLFLDNKFCDDPTAPEQRNCASFISNVLAAGASSYQNVSGKVIVDNTNGTTDAITIRNASNLDQVLAIGMGGNGNAATGRIVGQYGLDIRSIYNHTAYYLTFGTANTERMRIDNSGKIGIGTPSPGSPLSIKSTAAVKSVIGITDATNYTLGIGYGGSGVGLLYGDTGSSLALGTNGTEKVRIDTTGRVGIGTATPGTTLDINGSGRSKGFVATDYNTTNWSGIGAEVGSLSGNAYFSGYNRSAAGYVNTYIRGANIYLQNYGITHFTLDTSGNVAITGSLTAASKNFEINHPAKPGYKLIHSSLEGPEVGVYYRGESRLVQGKATIILPDYFEALTQKGNRTVLLTPKFDDDDEPISNLAASSVTNGKFNVRAIDNSNNSQKFYWEVKAVRSDIPSLTVEKPADQNK